MSDLSLSRCTSQSTLGDDSNEAMLDWSAGEDWRLPLPVSIECFGTSHETRSEDPATDWNPL
jgi:hypothetical protein